MKLMMVFYLYVKIQKGILTITLVQGCCPLKIQLNFSISYSILTLGFF